MGNLSTSINRKDIYLHRCKKNEKKDHDAEKLFFAKCGAYNFLGLIYL